MLICLDPTNRLLSNRDLLDPTEMAVPFKKRIRPGMIVSLKRQPASGSSRGVNPAKSSPGEGSKLAVILCPLYSNVTGRGGVGSGIIKFLCAIMVPGPVRQSHELRLWQHVVVDVDMMVDEVFLGYDVGTRLYHPAV